MDAPPGALFSPSDPASAGYKHPRPGVDGYETRLWIGADAKDIPRDSFGHAKRHYVRLHGFQDVTTGSLTIEGCAAMLHEVGHCFFLDDMYDTSKYPRPLPACGGCSLHFHESIMSMTKDNIAWYAMRLKRGHTNALRPLDHVMLRRSWQKQRAKFAAV